MISITARQLRAERQKIRHTKALLVPLGFLGFENPLDHVGVAEFYETL